MKNLHFTIAFILLATLFLAADHLMAYGGLTRLGVITACRKESSFFQNTTDPTASGKSRSYPTRWLVDVNMSGTVVTVETDAVGWAALRTGMRVYVVRLEGYFTGMNWGYYLTPDR